MYLPSFARSRGSAAGARPAVRPLATIALHNGETFAVALDEENGSYLERCRGERGAPGYAHVVWFETIDGWLIGLNLDHVKAISWASAEPQSPGLNAWDRGHVTMNFATGQRSALPRMSGDEIDRLRGATLMNRRKPPYAFDKVTYITMPAAWLDDE